MKRIDPAFVRSQIDALVTRFPELEGDEELRADMIEAETDVHEFLALLIRKKAEADSYSVGIKSYQDELGKRRARMERRSEAARELMFRIMEAANLPSVELPEATISIRSGSQKVIITNDALIPDEYVKVERTPKKAEIAKALKEGTQVPGASLSNAEPSLTVRMG